MYIAQSLDGYIAKEDGDISWLSIVERDNEDYGYQSFIETVDTVIMGRKTYDKVLSFGVDFPHKDKKCYVISNTLKGSGDDVQYFSGNIEDLIISIRQDEGKDIFVDGGAEVIRELKDKNLIDEYIISIIPILLGKGIRLFKETDSESRLKLMECKVFDSGLVQLEYKRTEYATAASIVLQ